MDLIRDVEKDTYSKGWQFWVDVFAIVHADSSAIKEQLKNGVEMMAIGPYFIPLIRWGSHILDKVCAILDKYRNLGYKCQSDDREIRDAWVEYNTQVTVFEVWCGLLCYYVFLQLDSKREMSAERKKYDSEHRPDLEYCPKKPVSWQILGRPFHSES